MHHPSMMEMIHGKVASDKMPLPGEHQGTSGAIAGSDSMRTDGGRMLNRWAPAGKPENITAEHLRRTHHPSSPHNTESDASVGFQPLTTRAGNRRQKMKWSKEMNKYIIYCYLKVTKMDTEMIAYREPLHRMVLDKYSELSSKTVQNIADQRRAIMTKKWLLESEMEQIRKQVVKELNPDTQQSDENLAQTDSVSSDLSVTDNKLEMSVPNETSVLESKIRQTWEEQYAQLHGTDPLMRPKLPRMKYNYRTKLITTQVDKILADEIKHIENLEEFHSLVYIGAVTALEVNGQKPYLATCLKQTRNDKPPWERRLENKIENLRKCIGKLTAANRNNCNIKVKQEAERIMLQYKNEVNKTGIEVLDLLKQTLAAKCKRLRRYRECNERRRQNAMFQTNEKAFYRSLQKEDIQKEEEDITPSLPEMKNFWDNIWAQPEQHEQAEWIKCMNTDLQTLPRMEDHQIIVEEVKLAIKKTQNWKGPRRDGVHNFWYKYFPSTHGLLAELFTEVLNNPEKLPPFMTCGLTYLIPKSKPLSGDPGKYRPITCLPTLYKLLTSVIADKIYRHLDKNNIMAEEQKGCRKSSQGCKEQLLIDATITGHVKKTGGSLYTAYIDYQKAFDSVPHSWLIDVLKMYKVDVQLIGFMKTQMQNWNTRLHIHTQKGDISTEGVKIRRGIFQGDSLSALWFCLAMNPLSTLLNKDGWGYNMKGKYSTRCISHLLHMDDLKLFSPSRKKLMHLLDITNKFSRDIRMQFGTEKCRLLALKRGKWQQQAEYVIEQEDKSDMTIDAMNEGEYYKYLGCMQQIGIDHKIAKNNITQEFNTRLKKILKTKLSAGRKFTAINTYVIPILTYSFGVIKWSETELEGFNSTCGVLCTKFRCQHPKSAIERFHLPRSMGGRGVLDVVNLYHGQLKILHQYFQNKAASSILHQVVMENDHRITPLNMAEPYVDTAARSTTNDTKMLNWKEKQLHGRYPGQLERDHIDGKASVKWLCKGDLFAETEGFIMAIQDQVIPTKNYRRFILKDMSVIDDKCRMCKDQRENIDHIISGCKALASSEYLRRHNNVCKVIHQELCHNNQLQPGNKIPYYKYTPENVVDTPKHKIYWNRSIITDQAIPANMPDIVWHDKENKTVYLIDVAVPAVYNIQKKSQEKIQKYEPLTREIREMWKSVDKVQTVPIIIGATGEIPTALHGYLSMLKLNKGLYIQLQKIVILDTCHTVRKVLNVEL